VKELSVQPRPVGYRGVNHQTIGSDILSVLNAVHFPEAVLGEDVVKKLNTIDPEGWYPIQDLLELMDTLEQRLGVGGLTKMGRHLFKLSHEAKLLEVASSGRDIVYGFNGLYHYANRGEGIGGWKVLRFEDGLAVMEKNTPHHCAMEEGIMVAAFGALNIPTSIKQERCLRRGDGVCQFKLDSTVRGERWLGAGQG
jgi:hypothetical protein